jgi:hypothetical protein
MYTLTFKDREEEWDSDEDLGEEDLPELDESFMGFLRRHPKGPKLSPETVELISRYGVVNTESLVTLSQYPLEKLLALFTNREFRNLCHEDVKNLNGYGRYISQHDLITTQGSINLEDFQPILYTLYHKTERRNLSRNFRSIFQTEMGNRNSTGKNTSSPRTQGREEPHPTITPGTGQEPEPGPTREELDFDTIDGQTNTPPPPSI